MLARPRRWLLTIGNMTLSIGSSRSIALIFGVARPTTSRSTTRTTQRINSLRPIIRGRATTKNRSTTSTAIANWRPTRWAATASTRPATITICFRTALTSTNTTRKATEPSEQKSHRAITSSTPGIIVTGWSRSPRKTTPTPRSRSSTKSTTPTTAGSGAMSMSPHRLICPTPPKPISSTTAIKSS